MLKYHYTIGEKVKLTKLMPRDKEIGLHKGQIGRITSLTGGNLEGYFVVFTIGHREIIEIMGPEQLNPIYPSFTSG